MPIRHIVISGLLIGLAGCGAPTQKKATGSDGGNAVADAVASYNVALPSTPMPAALPEVDGQPLSCAADIGSAAAQKRVAICRNVSPATRPPCNVANSCAMIEDEIARSCALFDGQGEPMPGCAPTPKSMEAAAAVVSRYYSAINARDYATAWSQWGEDGRPGQTLAQFEAGFAQTRTTRVTIGRLEPGDAGAGSIYQTVPVAVDAQLADGARQRFVGDYVLRRVNGVDGASPAQLRWHIDSARLKPAPVG
ncbi:hypothetical protein [Sphingobium sp.]|uniref:hypothetical protein n=1 Tax=Sphingobium sp. TaxID=1912891 RepID=UPI0026150C3E|nr:hypothetical protein [Sphingobium sp.]